MEAAITIAGEKRLKSCSLGPVKVSGAICYEMDFPKFIQQAGQMGAELILAPSNDWPEIKNMHARMARLRAIENGISVFRPTAGGISLAVDPYGRPLSQVDNSTYLSVPFTAVIPVERVSTIFPAWGNTFNWICAVVSFIFMLLALLKRLFPNKLRFIK
jgi:apolipoprotein N-acyltransferase